MRALRPGQIIQACADSRVSRDSGKAKLAAPLAVARKLLVVLNAILRTATPWDEAKHA